MKNEITFCKSCLLPSNYLNIKIDEEGVCNQCREFKPTEYLGKERLLKEIQEPLKLNTSKKYDCVIGFSGGRDSTYLLWFVVKELKLKPLAVFADDLFIPDIALENMKNTCQILGVDLRSIKHDSLKRNIKHHLNAWIKRPVPESLMFINVGERIGYETLVELEAIKEGVKLIFGGRTSIQEGAKYKKELMLINNHGGTFSWILGYLKQVILNPSLATNPLSLKTQYREFMVNRWKMRLVKNNNLTIIHPYFKYIQWKESEIERVLFEELQWRIPEGRTNSSRFGCEIDTLRQFLFYRTLRYNDTNVDLSYLIRDKQISREVGKLKLSESLNFEELYIKYILNKAGVNSDDFIKKLNEKYPITN